MATLAGAEREDRTGSQSFKTDARLQFLPLRQWSRNMWRKLLYYVQPASYLCLYTTHFSFSRIPTALRLNAVLVSIISKNLFNLASSPQSECIWIISQNFLSGEKRRTEAVKHRVLCVAAQLAQFELCFTQHLYCSPESWNLSTDEPSSTAVVVVDMDMTPWAILLKETEDTSHQRLPLQNLFFSEATLLTCSKTCHQGHLMVKMVATNYVSR